MKKTIYFSFLWFFASCSSSPEKAIVKRWKTIDVNGSGREDFIERQAKAKAEGKDSPSRDLEFQESGEFHAYDEQGILAGQGTYTMAPDGKSLLVHEKNGSHSAAVQIVELNSSKLSIVAPDIFGRDTIIMTPR